MSELKTKTTGLHRSINVADLVFLNVAAILGLRWLSTAAQMGPSSLVLWLLAVLFFFIPSGLTIMELSSRDPGEGGIYLWSKAAFGEQHGFISGWAYWVNNLFYFPSLLLFISGTFLHLGGNQWVGLGENALYNAGFSLTLLWIVIGINVLGVERGKWIQNIGALCTVLVFVVLAVAGIWVWSHFGSATVFTLPSLVPDLSSFSTLTFFATMTFAFGGLELGPVMGGEIKNPSRSIPRAMVIAGFIIAGIYILGTALLMVAVPEADIAVITGIPQSFLVIANKISLRFLAVLGAGLVVLSSTGGLSAWVSGVARIPYVIGIDRYLPAALGKTHPKWGTPYVALLLQGAMVTILMLTAVAGSTIEEAYIMLLDMCIILYFLPFLYMFAALPVLRRKSKDNQSGVSLIPGGMFGVCLVAGIGFAVTLLSVILAFIPPHDTEKPLLFFIKVAGGSTIFIGIGLAFYYTNHKS